MFRKDSDFDGDGKADFAITRNVGGLKYWWIWQTTDGQRVIHWGVNFDQRAASDYDGDGKTDLAIWRSGAPGYYWIKGSQAGIIIFPWGTSGDAPVTY